MEGIAGEDSLFWKIIFFLFLYIFFLFHKKMNNVNLLYNSLIKKYQQANKYLMHLISGYS